MITDTQIAILEVIDHQISGLEDQREKLSAVTVRIRAKEGTIEREITLEVLEALRSNGEALKDIREKLAHTLGLVRV